MAVTSAATSRLTISLMTTWSRKEFYKTEAACTRPRRLLGVTPRNRYRPSHISRAKTIVLFSLVVRSRGRRTLTLFMDLIEFFREDCQFPGHLVTLKRSERNLEAIQMSLWLHLISKSTTLMTIWISFCLDVSNLFSFYGINIFSHKK